MGAMSVTPSSREGRREHFPGRASGPKALSVRWSGTMRGLVDIHTHLLPGIDDGPATLDESLEMARVAVASGIGTIAATPHLRSDFPDVYVEELASHCQVLQGAVDRAQ